MTPSKDTISWQEWAESPAVTPSTQVRRKRVLRDWAEANGKDSPQALLDDIFLDKVTPYSAANKFLNHLREQDMAPGTIALYRSMLGGEGDAKSGAGFFLSTLGDENFSVRKYNQLVPAGDNYTRVGKKAPTVDELRHILRNLANPRARALLGMLSVTGTRIEECLSRKMSEIERVKDAYARIRLQAGITKKRYVRYAFLTKEVVDWIDSYHTTLTHSVIEKDGKTRGTDTKWVFPGERGEHLDRVSAYQEIKALFDRAGLKDTEDEIYSPHSMRKFAENQMIRCGLGDKFVRLITGHTTNTERAYGDWRDIEAEWVEKCAEKMTWLTDRVEIVKVPDPAQERKIKELEDKFGKLTEALRHLLLGEGVHESAEDIRKLLGWDKEPQEYKIVLKDGRRVSKEELEAYLKARERKALPEPDNSEVTDAGTKVGSGA